MKLRRLIPYLLPLVFTATIWTGCEDISHDYSAGSFLLFNDSIQTCPVWDTGEWYDVEVGVSKPFGKDRWVAVEVVDALSSAIEGEDYVIEAYNVLLPAGSYTTNVRVRGVAENIEDNESKYLTLRLVADTDVTGQSYTPQTKVILRKATPFNIDDLLEDGGYWYEYELVSGGSYHIIKAEKVDNERIRFVNYLGQKRDLIVRITGEGDIFSREVEILPQYVMNAQDDLGMIYGRSVKTAVSYYRPTLRAFQIYMQLYVEGVAIFGNYPFVIIWVSEEEARYMIDKGYADNLYD